MKFMDFVTGHSAQQFCACVYILHKLPLSYHHTLSSPVHSSRHLLKSISAIHLNHMFTIHKKERLSLAVFIFMLRLYLWLLVVVSCLVWVHV